MSWARVRFQREEESINEVTATLSDSDASTLLVNNTATSKARQELLNSVPESPPVYHQNLIGCMLSTFPNNPTNSCSCINSLSFPPPRPANTLSCSRGQPMDGMRPGNSMYHAPRFNSFHRSFINLHESGLLLVTTKLP